MFIPCMNQAGQMLILRSHGEWTKNENYDEVSNNTSTIGKGPPEKAVGKK